LDNQQKNPCKKNPDFIMAFFLAHINTRDDLGQHKMSDTVSVSLKQINELKIATRKKYFYQ